MARDEKYADLMSAAEALLFVSDEPVGSAKLAGILQVDPSVMDEALALLSAEYVDENRGMQLREVAGGWRFFTHPAHNDIIERYVISWDTHRMSQAALEALAIIAYHQPVTRAGVNAIRGVNSEGVVSSLVEKGLVREMGRDKPGGAIRYGTTRAFLERFGLKSVADLPPLEDFAPDDDSRQYIRERLSGNAKSDDAQLDMDGDNGELLEDGISDIEIAQEDGSFIVEQTDSGDESRVDDEDAISSIIGESMTEKVAAFEIYGNDEELDVEPDSNTGDSIFDDFEHVDEPENRYEYDYEDEDEETDEDFDLEEDDGDDDEEIQTIE